MPKEWLCAIVLGEKDVEDTANCLHCLRLTPPERDDLDHVRTKLEWCNTRLERVLVRDSDHRKPSRTYRPIGWYCGKCDKLMTASEYEELDSAKQAQIAVYSQREEEYYNAVGKGWDWVFEERKRLGWPSDED
jgi:hypothetical protein